jgi:hypothetical protein
MHCGSWIPALHCTAPPANDLTLGLGNQPASWQGRARTEAGPWMESLPENPGWWGVNPLSAAEITSPGGRHYCRLPSSPSPPLLAD